ncbi:MAG TPA: sigma-70 family RNA polymerase sigma factor [Thermoanaerobaculia bacterium]|jgi:RNA polymerase sigma factor (sigma-70 family)
MPVNGGDDSAGPPPSGVIPVEDAYRFHSALLKEIAEKKFRVPPGDAEGLVNDVFLAFLIRGVAVRDPRKWLIGAVCHASRGYWRAASKTLQLPPDIDEYMDPRSSTAEAQIVDSITFAAALSRLGEKCRDTLRMYYIEGYSAAEIAERLDTTSGYVMQLLHHCRKRLRDIYCDLSDERKL